MVKHLLVVVVALLALMVATPALAVINPEPFLPSTSVPPDPPNGYIAGTPLSAYYFDQNPGGLDGNGDPIPPVDTTGALDIEDVGGGHGLVVKLTVDGPGFAGVLARATGWGGPPRANGQLWFSVDIEKGTGGPGTPLADNIWELKFTRNNDAALVYLQGSLTTAKVRNVGGTSTTPGDPVPPYATSTLNDGWNELAVLSDLTATPNTEFYFNRVLVGSVHLDPDTGPLSVEAAANQSNRVTLARLGRSETYDMGSMRFDNIVTADGRPGDANHDHNVDIFDINLISSNWGSPGGPDGDANGDGNVDIFDINLISSNWAPAPPPGGSAAVPEPGTWVLLLVGLAGLLAVRRKRIGR